jgi:hypothetical protein
MYDMYLARYKPDVVVAVSSMLAVLPRISVWCCCCSSFARCVSCSALRRVLLWLV